MATKSSARTSRGKSDSKDDDAIGLLKADHRKVEGLFKKYEKADDDEKDGLIEEICNELTVHTMIEEEIFYPACRDAVEEEEPLDEAQVEHDGAKVLINDLSAGSADDPYRDAKVKVLAEYINHHVEEEEKPRSGIFARAEKAGINTAELAQRLDERKQALMDEVEDLPAVKLVSLAGAQQEVGA